MRIALLGYGRMGREIELAAASGGHTIAVKTDIHNAGDFNSHTAAECEVAIEFTGPGAAAETIISALIVRSTGGLRLYGLADKI